MSTIVQERPVETMRPVPVALPMVTWNASVTQPMPELRANLSAMLHDSGAWVAALQEAKRLNVTVPGFHRIAAPARHPREGADSCQLLVRRGIGVVRRFVVNVQGPDWRGPHQGVMHDPRVFVGGVLSWHAVRFDVLCVHRVPGGHRVNEEAYAAEHAAIVDWCRTRATQHPHRPRILLGDWNADARDSRPMSPSKLAAQVGGRLVLRGIDGAILINCQPDNTRKLPRKYGSDTHRPVALTASVRGRGTR